MVESAPRSLRQDAARNRDSLLAAARHIFAEQGPDAPLEDVARAAQVSRTTLYRHFATREELAAVVFEGNVARIEERALELRERPDGIVTLMDFILDMQRDNRSLAQVLSSADLGWFTGLSVRTQAALEPLLEHGHAAGIVHASVDMEDLMLVFPMASGAMADSDAAGRQQADGRVRRLLYRALFTERARY